MKVKFMNFKEMAITQNTGMCSYLTIAWAVPYMIRQKLTKLQSQHGVYWKSKNLSF